MSRGPGLLLVAHGSRVAEAAHEMATLVELIRTRVPAPLTHGWIELAEPAASDAGRTLIADGCRDLVVLPLLMFRAYHASTDVPAVAQTLALEHPTVRIRVGSPLGLDPRLAALAAERVLAADGAPRGAVGSALLVVSSGSSDPDAQAAAATAARMVAERTGHDLAGHAFASSATPDTATAVADLVTRGARSLRVFSWSLLDGRLVRGVEAAAVAAAAACGVELIWTGRFGSDPVVADVVADRYLAAAGH